MQARRILVLALLILVPLALLIARVYVSTAPIRAAAYTPPPPPELTGPLAPNEALRRTELIARGRLRGPEDVAIDDQGRIYAGTMHGEIVRVVPAAAGGSETVEVVARTGGRPLGLAWPRDGSGDLLVADAFRGLLAVDPGSGAVRVLATEAEGLPFRFTDDLDVAADGTVYFSDASSVWDQHHYLYDLLEARPHGRLLAYRPEDGEVEVLADDLYFANGVALAADESFVLVNETYRYRIQRCWLRGAERGRCEPFADNLPGFPDGIASDRAGTFWVAMFTVRNPTVDRLHPHPWAKNLLSGLPKAWWPKPAPYGLVLALDEEGRIVRSLHDPGGEVVRAVTSVEPHRGALYLGNLEGDWIGRWQPPGD